MSIAENTETDPASAAGAPYASASYSMVTADGREDGADAKWRFSVCVQGNLITREVWRDGTRLEQSCHDWEPERVIWPTWPRGPEDESWVSSTPLADVEEYWKTAGNRLRESSKWLATVLGAALAVIAGTSPLSQMKQHAHQPIVLLIGSLGLLLLFVTMLLVIQVMRPQSVSFTDVQYAKRRRQWLWRMLLYKKALYKWQTAVEKEPDLYLPCEVRCLTALRESMIIEEGTLMALSRAKASAQAHDSRQVVCDAQAARAARLLELRMAAAKIATVGEYYKLRCRSTWATYGGLAFGLAGTACIIAAFIWPVPTMR